MRKPTLIALAVAGIIAPIAAVQVADAELVQSVVSASPLASRAGSATPTSAASLPTSSTPSASVTPSATPSSTTPTSTTSTSTPSPTAERTPARPAALLGIGSTGERVRQVQGRLARAGYFDHEVTGYYGPVTAQAVKSYQRAVGLEATGELDRVGLDRIMALPAPKVTPKPTPTNTPTSEPSATSRPSSKPTASTRPSTKPTATNRPAGQPRLDARCLNGRVVCIDKTRQRLYWVVDGTVLDSFSTRTGRPGLATREGTFSIYQKDVNSWSRLYKVYMPYSLYFSGGQAVHYSSEFATQGYGVGSHGCVNLRDRRGAAWLFNQTRVGDKVVVYRS